jgi:hypothetical protein
MELLLKAVKISLLILLVFVLAVVFAPTPKGAFVIVHFTTTLQAWFLVQILFTALVIAARTPRKFVPRLQPIELRNSRGTPPIDALAVRPLRC